MILINKTLNGQIFQCDSCDAIHIEFKNLNFNFSIRQFDRFADYISNLKGEDWEKKNENSLYKRKIIISFGIKSFNMLVNKEELAELNQLLNQIKNKNVQNITFGTVDTENLNLIPIIN